MLSARMRRAQGHDPPINIKRAHGLVVHTNKDLALAALHGRAEGTDKRVFFAGDYLAQGVSFFFVRPRCVCVHAHTRTMAYTHTHTLSTALIPL